MPKKSHTYFHMCLVTLRYMCVRQWGHDAEWRCKADGKPSEAWHSQA